MGAAHAGVMACAILLFSCAPAPTGLSVSAIVKSPVPGSTTAVGYGVLENHTDGEVVVSGVTSAHTSSIEFHTTVVVDGLSRMRRLKSIALAPGEGHELRTGGDHLMLFGFQPPARGPVDLVFEYTEDGVTQTVKIAAELLPFDAVIDP